MYIYMSYIIEFIVFHPFANKVRIFLSALFCINYPQSAPSHIRLFLFYMLYRTKGYTVSEPNV